MKLEDKIWKRLQMLKNNQTKISPVAMFASQFGPLNTRDYFYR